MIKEAVALCSIAFESRGRDRLVSNFLVLHLSLSRNLGRTINGLIDYMCQVRRLSGAVSCI